MKHDRTGMPLSVEGSALIDPASESDPGEDDARLIELSRCGDSAAFGQLVSRYQDRLYTMVMRLLNNVEDTQDVVQEAFLQAFQNLSAFKGDSQFYTWLYRIAMNAAVSQHRKRAALLLLLHSEQLAANKVDPSDVSQPGHRIEQSERVQAVREALGLISLEHRAVLVMKDMEGMKYEEISEVLGVPIGTIRSRLHRARLELRSLLEKN